MDRLARLRAFLSRRRPEAAIVVFGILLRASLNLTYDVNTGYDWPLHQQYIRWIVDHHELPRFDLNAATYHPPLFYWLASFVLRAGFTMQAVGWISIIAGCLRLVVVWVGLELYLPGRRFARIVALALLAVFPADLMLDGMSSNEGLSTLFCAVATLLLPLVIAGQGSARRRHGLGAALGLALGLALLSKISATAIVMAAAIGAALTLGRAIVTGTRAPRSLLARVAPLLTAVSVMAAVSGWFFVRNYQLYGMPAPTAYDGIAHGVVDPFFVNSFLDRRPLGYVTGFNTYVFVDPYYPTASQTDPLRTQANSRFHSILIASTFADYFNFGFGLPRPGEEAVSRNHRPLRKSSFELSRWSVAGGAVLAVMVIAAWLAAARHLWRRGDDALLALLAVPLLAVLGQLTFAIKYPNDTWGPVKGVYLQFGMTPLFALVGLTMAWAWRSRRTRWLAVLGIAAQLAIATYSLQCRVPPIGPAFVARLAAPPPPAPAKPPAPAPAPNRAR